LQVLESGVVGRHHASARAGLDRHVAHGEALLDAHRAHCAAGVLDDVANRAGGADLGDDREDHVLGGHARGARALDADAQGLRRRLPQRLRGEHMLVLGLAHAERERAERAVRGGMAVAAHQDHAGLADAELRADDVDDALALVAEQHVRDAVLLHAGRVGLDHAPDLGRRRVGRIAADGGHVVVGRAEGALRAAHLEAALREAFARVEAAVVHDVTVDVEQDLAGAARDYMPVPDLLEKTAWHWSILERCRYADWERHSSPRSPTSISPGWTTGLSLR
jgi:hypothetical protein